MSPGGLTPRWWHFSSGDDDSVDNYVGADSGSAAPIRAPEVSEMPEQRSGADEVIPLLAECRTILTGQRYIRHSDSHSGIESLQYLAKIGSQGPNGLEGDELRDWQHLIRHAEPSRFEVARKQNNQVYVDRQRESVHAAIMSDMPTSLTDEQARAVAQDEDVTLVLAGAGTGKTSVIVGKALYLVQGLDVDPSQILVLAFNRKAAEEIRERLPGNLAGVQVSTFHSFGRRVIAESEVAPTVSRLATDNFACTRALTGILEAMLRDPRTYQVVMEFLAYRAAPYRSPFEFKTVAEYEEYVRSVERRNLNGDLVRSYEEVLVSNFLTEHGVKFRYERPYEENTADRKYQQYRPDFYLPEYDIYIEHFALDRNGRPPEMWGDYSESVEWKRQLHRNSGTNLIESHSWEIRDIEFDALRQKLEGHGVEMERRNCAELVIQLAKQKILVLADLLNIFMKHAKAADLSVDDMLERAGSGSARERSQRFLTIYETVRERYEQLLQDEGAVDFTDLIKRATGLVQEGTWTSLFRYVLVDEFQDISADRMALLKSLNSPEVAYFLVGDDWQSIYRFAGSDVQLMMNCSEYLGHVVECHLTQTFRFGERVQTPSTGFIQANPEQSRRVLKPAETSRDRGVTIVRSRTQDAGLARSLLDIAEHADESESTVLVLGRFNKSQKVMPAGPGSETLKLEFSTVHRAKGREADYVVVLDLRDGYDGFPSKITDDPVLQMVLPPVSAQPYPFAEERRLFYVAVTRSRRGSYLVTDFKYPSGFVDELQKLDSRIEVLGPPPVKCPLCREGNMLSSSTGRTLRCSNSPTCSGQAPRCLRCNFGYILVESGESRCLNPTCTNAPRVCPACGRGVLLPRKGRYGSFFGCSRYWSEPPCGHMERPRSRGTARR